MREVDTVKIEELNLSLKNFQLKDLQGNNHTLSGYKGKTLVVNYWASWCGPCREEIPAMNRAWAQLKSHEVVMLGINFGESATTVEEFVQEMPIDFSVLLDEESINSSAWQVSMMPTTFIINAHGQLIEKILGPREWDSDEMIKKIIQVK
jgi:peroxiredoxin